MFLCSIYVFFFLGLTFLEITTVSACGVLLFTLVATLASISLFKKHSKSSNNYFFYLESLVLTIYDHDQLLFPFLENRNTNIPDKENENKITPYATVRISGVFAFQAEINGYGQPRTPYEERSDGKRDLQKPPYENINHLGRSAVNPLEYLFFQPRYENEAIDNEACDVVMIRPGYDKLTPVAKGKGRENGGAHLGRRLPCGLVDKDGLPVYDSLNREIDLKRESRKADFTDSEIEEK